MQSLKLTAPLRIDFCGGYTDIAEISKVTGTAIANVAIDLYRDAARTQPVLLQVLLNRADGANGTEEELRLLSALNTYAQTYLQTDMDYRQSLQLQVQVPVSMGLGVSSTLSVLLTSAARLHQGWDLATIRDHAFRDAQLFEKDILQVKGGYQDFIPAIYGGYNWITAESGGQGDGLIKDPDTVAIATYPVPPAIATYLNTCVVIVYSLRPASSSKIIDDIVNRSTDHSEQEQRLLEVSRRIHHYNVTFHHYLCEALSQAADSDSTSPALPFAPQYLAKLIDTIDHAWELRQQFSPLAANPVLDQVAQAVAADVYCAHGVGAGGSVLVLYAKPDRLDSLYRQLAALSQQFNITLFYPNVNQTGVAIDHPH
ncbi:MAG: hypothetical protein NZ772_18020 [Cyanobacteria bacterium]|nr:hypothetical protein [Cyanobacteriota bacterium]MDW8203172.1 hypothetical protein [Cyanobacteriota bacterium SKYGB_h_bin112]